MITLLKLVLQATIRTCIGCGSKRSKNELVRFVLAGDELAVDPTMRLPGRGVYMCPAEACLLKGISTKALSRSFRQKIKPELVSALKSVMIK